MIKWDKAGGNSSLSDCWRLRERSQNQHRRNKQVQNGTPGRRDRPSSRRQPGSPATYFPDRPSEFGAVSRPFMCLHGTSRGLFKLTRAPATSKKMQLSVAGVYMRNGIFPSWPNVFPFIFDRDKVYSSLLFLRLYLFNLYLSWQVIGNTLPL